MAIYQPSQPWQGRNDGDEANVQRWHQIINYIYINKENIKFYSNKNFKVALLGFCSDEGVRRNQGRMGAKDGPAAIRKACSSFPVHFEKIQLLDVGDVICDDGNLETAQTMLGGKIQQLMSDHFFPIVLGGGHETAFANFCGIQQIQKNNNTFGVINFDAHFDLRHIDQQVGATSGTGFWQMEQITKNNNINFEYLAIGIQQCSNTKKLFQTANAFGVSYILAEDFNEAQYEQISQSLNHILEKSSLIQLSIDMDVFNAANAPGVSAPAFNGILPNTIFKRLLRRIIQSGKVASIDIAEVNPTYDIDNRTARLAASLIFDIVQTINNYM